MGAGASFNLPVTTVSSANYSFPSSVPSHSSRSFQLPSSNKDTPSPLSFFFPSIPKISHYFIGSIIGQGGFGKIREIKRRRDNRWFALKSFEFDNMTLREVQAITTELLALNRIPSNPFVIQFHAAFRERSAISLVMDLLVGGDLRFLLRSGEKLDEIKIAYIVACVGSALHHIHSHQVIHRDVKPENIMFTKRGIPKLIDFGIAYLSPLTSNLCVCQSRSGTIQYMSPEALVPKTHCHGYESDFWSLGIVMYEMLYCSRPYETRVPSGLVEYSEETYKADWKSLLDLVQSVSELEIPAASPISNSFGFPPAPSLPSAPQLGWYSFHLAPAVEEEENFPLHSASPLVVPLPGISPHLDAYPSEHCLSLLFSLLDVRIHKRCGVGENYSAFSEHAFFVSHNMAVENILSVPSPIDPDLMKIGRHLWNQFFSANLDDETIAGNPSESQIPCYPSQEVEDYLTQVQSSTPLFYESNSDSIKNRNHNSDVSSTLRDWGLLRGV
jgi:serine/threonine protein kinase